MAIIWSETINGNLYEVRSAGASLRLYRNGVHHSQFNPNRPLAGGIWDLLTITSLFRSPDQIQQALILGFGAGAAGRLLRELVNPERIVGIDLDPIHLSIAGSFFQCSEGCELLAADAIEWVGMTSKDSSSLRFDWVLDDLYSEDNGIPVRCGPESATWFRKLARLVTPQGMLVVNLVEPSQVRKLPLMTDRSLIKRFPYVTQFSMAAYDNRILALSRKPFERAKFYTQLSEFCHKYPSCRGVVDKYRIRAIRR